MIDDKSGVKIIDAIKASTKDKPFTQDQLISLYSDQVAYPFNEALFYRTEDEIIYYLKQIILACQRDYRNGNFLIKVIGFKVVDSIEDIETEIRNYYYEQFMRKNKDSKTKRVFDTSKFGKIDLKETAYKLLVVKYYCSIAGQADYFTSLIKIPRVVNKYYFYIYGNYYLALNQIVDASTYNNTNSKANKGTKKKKSNVSFRTNFMKTMMFRNNDILIDTKTEPHELAYFISYVFTKPVYTWKYLFARFGFFEALDFMNMRHCIWITNYDPNDPNMYTFCRKENTFYISTPKELFDTEEVIQSLVYTVYTCVSRDKSYMLYPFREFWLRSLGGDFGTTNIEKGLGILSSLENIYDPVVKAELHIPEYKKDDIFYILKWMMGNYMALRQKDNLDISTKRVRWGQHIASTYANKLSRGVHRIGDIGNKANIDVMRKAIVTPPDFLLKEVSHPKSGSLVSYLNMVNEDDAVAALKFSFKGISGIGEKSKSAIPNAYRAVNLSHIDRIDVTQSSNSDPGMSGLIVPMVDLYNGSFSEYEEPNSWDDIYNKKIAEYRAANVKPIPFYIKEEYWDKNYNPKMKLKEDGIDTHRGLIVPFYIMTDEDKATLSLD